MKALTRIAALLLCAAQMTYISAPAVFAEEYENVEPQEGSVYSEEYEGEEPSEETEYYEGDTDTDADADAEIVPDAMLTAGDADGDSSSEEAQRGVATYYGTVIDKAALYDDEELKRIGFDDTDIEYLKKGLDVTYSIQHDRNYPKRYDDLDEGSTYKRLIDDHYSNNGKKGAKPNDSLMTYYYPARARGSEEPEPLDDIKNVRGSVEFALSYDQGNVHDYISNGTFTMLYLDADTAQSTDVKVSANASENVVIDFEFIGTGNYIILYDQNETSSSQSDSSSSGDGSDLSSDLSSDSDSSGVTSDSPDTGVSVSLAAVAITAGAAVVMYKKKKR